MSDHDSPEDDDVATGETPAGESLIMPFLGMVAMGVGVLALVTNPAMLLVLSAVALAGYAWTTRNDEPVVKGLVIMASPLLGELGIEIADGVHASGGMMIPMLLVTIPVGMTVMAKKNRAE